MMMLKRDEKLTLHVKVGRPDFGVARDCACISRGGATFPNPISNLLQKLPIDDQQQLLAMTYFHLVSVSLVRVPLLPTPSSFLTWCFQFLPAFLCSESPSRAPGRIVHPMEMSSDVLQIPTASFASQGFHMHVSTHPQSFHANTFSSSHC